MSWLCTCFDHDHVSYGRVWGAGVCTKLGCSAAGTWVCGRSEVMARSSADAWSRRYFALMSGRLSGHEASLVVCVQWPMMSVTMGERPLTEECGGSCLLAWPLPPCSGRWQAGCTRWWEARRPGRRDCPQGDCRSAPIWVRDLRPKRAACRCPCLAEPAPLVSPCPSSGLSPHRRPRIRPPLRPVPAPLLRPVLRPRPAVPRTAPVPRPRPAPQPRWLRCTD